MLVQYLHFPCIYVCVPSQRYFCQGLSLALRSYDQFKAWNHLVTYRESTHKSNEANLQIGDMLLASLKMADINCEQSLIFKQYCQQELLFLHDGIPSPTRENGLQLRKTMNSNRLCFLIATKLNFGKILRMTLNPLVHKHLKIEF